MKNKNNTNKLLEKNPENHELQLMNELSNEFSNFNKKFKGKVKHTLILSPGTSSCFGLDIFDDYVHFGVPEYLWDMFINIRWYVANVIPGKSGLFFVFDMGIKPYNHPVAIRFLVRTKRIEAISKYKKIKLIKIDNNGLAYPPDRKNCFELPIIPVKRLEWEYFNRS